jgi:LacI family transcriptional regulator
VDSKFSKIRIKDIARLAGVSPGTVDRVLHNRGEVSAKTRSKILQIIQEMDYQPDILASILANKKEIRIAVLIPEGKQDNPFWKYPVKGIEEGLRELRHFGIVLDSYLFDYTERDSFIEKSAGMLKNQYQGVILAPVFTDESALVVEECRKRDIPVVLINANICSGGCLAFIGQDSLQSGKVAARLMNYGLNGDPEILIVNFIRAKGNQDHILKREEGFRLWFSGMKEAPFLRQINIPGTGNQVTEGMLEEAISASEQGVGGIFVTNSRVFRVARFLERKNYKNIILIGYDLLEENREFLKKGTIDFLISQKPAEQGHLSVIALYHHLILREKVEKNQYLPVDILTKENLDHYTYT